MLTRPSVSVDTPSVNSTVADHSPKACARKTAPVNSIRAESVEDTKASVGVTSNKLSGVLIAFIGDTVNSPSTLFTPVATVNTGTAVSSSTVSDSTPPTV